MVQLVLTLSAIVAALMLTVKQLEASLTLPTDPAQLAQFNQRLSVLNILLSIAFGVIGAFIQLSNTPLLFANDPAFIANSPSLWAFAAGLMSILPGGLGTTGFNAVLTWLTLKNVPVLPAAQVIEGTATVVRKPRPLLWN